MKAVADIAFKVFNLDLPQALSIDQYLMQQVMQWTA